MKHTTQNTQVTLSVTNAQLCQINKVKEWNR